MKIGMILQSRFSNFNFFEDFCEKKMAFGRECLVKSKKSSTFACFFAARVRGHNARERENNN